MKKKTSLKILSVFLFVALAIRVVPFLSATQDKEKTPITVSAATTKMSLDELKAKFPQGKYWNHLTNSNHNNNGYAGMCTNKNCTNPDGWTSSACATHSATVTTSGKYDCNYFDGAAQCLGFALKLANDAYGESARNWDYVTNVNTVKAGDVITYMKTTSNPSGHTVFVTGVSGDKVYFGECNYSARCKIDWNRSLSKSQFTNIHKVLVAPYELTTNSNTLTINYHINGGTTLPTYKMGEATDLRSSTSTTNDDNKLLLIPKGAKILVTEEKVVGEYTWGKTTYKNQETNEKHEGWCILNSAARRFEPKEGIMYKYSTDERVATVWTQGSGDKETGLYNAKTLGLVKAGYTFAGWCKDSNGSSRTFDQDDKTLIAEDIEPTITSGSKSVTLYAVWKPVCTQGDHSGGSATCTEKAICENCQEPYGETLAHSFTILQKDKTHHWNKCENCETIDTKEEHIYADGNECEICENKKQSVIEISAEISGCNGYANGMSGSGLALALGTIFTTIRKLKV